MKIKLYTITNKLMETDTIQKNGANLKNQISRGYTMKRIFLFLGCFVLMSGSFILSAQTVHNLNNDTETTSLRSTGNSVPQEFLKEAKTARVFAINPALQSARNVIIGDKVALQLFENQDYMSQVTNITTDVNGTLALTLKFPEYPLGFAIITTSIEGKSLVTVSIPELGQSFGSRYNVSSGESYLIEIDGSKIERPHLENDTRTFIEKEVTNSDQAPQLRNVQADCGPLVDQNQDASVIISVLVVYTPAAASSLYTTNHFGINNVISTMIALGNTCLSNSQTGITLELAHSEQVTYTETDMNTSLTNLENPFDGYMDNVNDLRKQHNADLVQLVSIDAGGGLGDLLTTPDGQAPTAQFAGQYNRVFSVVNVTQVADDYPCSVHELGHNMGLGHGAQMINKSKGLFNYSYGWRWTGTTPLNMGGIITNMKGSVMTYWSGENYADGIPCYNVPYFSNPDISFEG